MTSVYYNVAIVVAKSFLSDVCGEKEVDHVILIHDSSDIESSSNGAFL